MKRKLIGILTLALVLSFGIAGFSSVAEARRKGKGNVRAKNCTYRDVNNDGICDNCDGNFVDKNNDGICDNHNSNCGRNFVDADNDGICDNRSSRNCRYIDADNDGVCDNCGSNFVDKNNDGICDNHYRNNYSSHHNGNGKGCGRHGRHH